VEQGEAIFLSP